MNNNMQKRRVVGDAIKAKPLEVEVRGSFEEAFRRFKSLVQRERIVGQYKERMSYEKPSEKRRRKIQESREKQIIFDALKDPNSDFEKRQTRKAKKKQERKERSRRNQIEYLKEIGVYNGEE